MTHSRCFKLTVAILVAGPPPCALRARMSFGLAVASPDANGGHVDPPSTAPMNLYICDESKKSKCSNFLVGDELCAAPHLPGLSYCTTYKGNSSSEYCLIPVHAI